GIEAFGHGDFETLVHHRFGPIIALAVLHPLEVRNRNAAGVGQNVRDHKDLFVFEYLIRQRRCGAVRAFAKDLATNAIGVHRGDDVFRRRGHQDFAFEEHGFVLIHILAAGETANVACLAAMLHQLRDVEAVLVVDGAIPLDDADDLEADGGHEFRRHPADVAESLNDHARGFGAEAEFLQGLQRGDHAAAAGGFGTSARAAEGERFAGDHGGFSAAHVHGIRIHEPRHDLLVGIDVGRRNVAVRSDEVDDFGGVAPGELFELGVGKDVRIDDDAPLTASERDVDDGALPRHPRSERAYFIERDVGRETNAPFSRTAHDRVLDAIAFEDFDAAVIEQDGYMHRDLAGGRAQNFLHPVIQAQAARGFIEARGGGEPWI